MRIHQALAVAGVGVIAATSFARGGSLLRSGDPVVVSGAALPTLTGRPVESVVAFRFDGGWVQIPVQVDERDLADYGVIYGQAPVGLTTLVYVDPGTYTGPDADPLLDANDEVAFMAADTGARAPAGAGLPTGVIGGTGVELTITDTLDPGAVGWAYLFETSGLLEPGAGVDYVSYQFDLLAGSYIPDYDTLNGPNPEDSVAESPHYRVHFSDRWIRDEINVFAGGASGVDLLDRHKSMFAPGACQRTEDTFSNGEGAFVTNKDGPVRAIRSYLGANSGPFTQREHVFYARREDVTTFLRVHAIPSVADLFDYGPDAAGMTYRDDLNPGGALIDGMPETLALGPITWEMVTGVQGSLIIALAFDTDVPGFAYTSYYADDLTPAVTQCTGDAFEYGTSGTFVAQAIPNTDPSLGAAFTMTGRRILYYEPPGQTVSTAILRHAQATTPLLVDAEPWDESVPGDLDGNGVVNVFDLLDLLAVFGQACPAPCPPSCPADITGPAGDPDCVIDVFDLLLLLANFG